MKLRIKNEKLRMKNSEFGIQNSEGRGDAREC